ncbi:MAG: FecR domain-containing protein [Opitutaceae bacterium]|nr:FecR domain-containing protein [Opitutaceae bacterium]
MSLDKSPSGSAPGSAAAIEEAAAEWLDRRGAPLDAEDEARFRRWREADPAHAAAYARLEQAWTLLNEPRRRGQGAALARALDTLAGARRRRFAFVGAAGLAAAALAVGLFVTRPPEPAADDAPSTIVVRPDRRTLPDGSVVELKAGARIDVAFTPEQRTVRLPLGEAMFHVTKNPARPFVVVAGGLEVKAVGTAFTVRNGGTEVGVLVTEGLVSVGQPAPPADAAGPVLLSAGDRVILASGHPVVRERLSASAIEQELAWRGKRVEFTGTPLAEAVELFNGHNRLQLAIADPALDDLQLTGIFWADDPEGFVRLLESGMGIRARRSPELITLRRQ